MDGFLGTRASLMLDVVALAMVAVLPVLAVSIYLVKVKRQFVWHKRIQLALGAALLITVVLFEADVRINGWRDRAAPSSFAGHEGQTDWVAASLGIHLFFSITSALLWALVIARALRNFPNPPQPAAHSHWHRRFGWLAAIDMALTAITGWIFYWLAFVC
jgi:hypothetical protein